MKVMLRILYTALVIRRRTSVHISPKRYGFEGRKRAQPGTSPQIGPPLQDLILAYGLAVF
jgi:hypothetical protein